MQSSSQIVNINKPKPSFLQAGCPTCHPTNSIRALKENFCFSTVRKKINMTIVIMHNLFITKQNTVEIKGL